MKKRVFRITLRVVIVLVLLLLAFLFALRYPAFQTFLAQKAASYLSYKLNTKVTIEKVQLTFFDQANFVNFYMEDLNGDTMIATQELDVRFRVFELFKKQISVRSITLNGGVVHLHRDTAGKLNLAETFAPLASPKDNPATPGKPFAWKIDLRRLRLNNTDFKFLDEKGHLDLKVALASFETELRKFDIDKKVLAINTIRLDSAYVAMDLLQRPINPNKDTLGLIHFLKDGMKVEFDEVVLTNSRFRMDDHNNDTMLPKGMDFKHLDLSGINLYAERGVMVADTVLLNIKLLKAKDRSGFAVKNLTTNARISVNEVTLDKLDILTSNSRVRNHLSFTYNQFGDFADFLNSVKIKARFEETRFSLKDLNYFVHTLDKVEHNDLYITGDITGSVSNLRGKNVVVRNQTGGTTFRGDFSTNGLPNFHETFLSLKVKQLSTNVNDIKQFYPGMVVPPNLHSLGQINFTGNFDGFATDFVTKGTLTTAIGSASTDINFKYDRKTNKSAYSGDLALNAFDLGKFFGDENTFGKVSLNGNIKGNGLTLESLNAKLEGNVASLTLKGYEYKDIKVNGSVVQKSFNGDLSIRDKYLSMDFSGKADITDSIPQFNFTATIIEAHLQKLNIIKQNIRISGEMKSDFSGNKPDNIVGNMQFSNLTMVRDDTVNASINYLWLDASTLASGSRKIKLKSEIAEGEFVGNFSFKELPKALLRFGKSTFTKDFVDTTALERQQNFNLDLRVFDTRNIPQIFLPQLHAIKNSRITSEFNSLNNELHLTAYVPELKYGKIKVDDLDITANSANGAYDFKGTISNLYNNDSLMLDTVGIVSYKQKDTEDVTFQVLATDKARYNYANITAYLTPQVGSAILRLDTSDIKLANYNWHFNQGNYTLIEGKKIVTNNLVFKSDDATIYITSYLKNDTSTSIKLTLDNTSISDFTGIFTNKMSDLHGVINGKLIVEDIFYKPGVFADLVVEDFKLGPELIGDVNIETKLDEPNKRIQLYATVKSTIINSDYNNLEAKGYISIDPLNPDLKIDISDSRVNLNFLNYRFFERYVNKVHGHAMINATVYGTLKKPLLKGKVTLVNDTVGVPFLNTVYHAMNQEVILDEHGFNLGDNLELYDINNNIIYGSGRINHESFRQFEFALDVYTPQAQFLNTTEKQSPFFYGVGYGKNASVTFRGPPNLINITANLTTARGTWCRLPVSSNYETARYSFYKFVSKEQDTVKVTSSPTLKLNGVDFRLTMHVTPDARMDIILDPVSGDMLTTYGTGDIKLWIPRNGNIRIDGLYAIDRGDYQFTLQTVVKKKFTINPGGTIDFKGDAYKAALNVSAAYNLRASVTDLFIDTSGMTQLALSAARARLPVKLLLNLTGILEKPNIAFDISVQDADPVIRSYLDQRLNMVKQNENELNTQVFGLLVMNRFLPSNYLNGLNGTGSFGNAVGGTATNTVSEFLSSQVSNYLSGLLDYTAMKDFQLNVGYRQYDQLQMQPDKNIANTPLSTTRREVNLAIQQRLLNDRLIVNAGGNLDIGGNNNATGVPGQTTTKAVIPTGDFQLEYLLTPEGSWRAKVFNRTNYDYVNSRNNNRTGLGVSYRQEFDNPADLINNFKKQRQERQKKRAEKKKLKEAERIEIQKAKDQPAVPDSLNVTP